MTVSLAAIPGAYHLPRLNWDVVRAWVDQQVDEPDRREAWTNIAMEWLDNLDKALGERYQTIRSDRLLLFAPIDEEGSVALLDFAEAGLAAIVGALGSLAGESWLGPLVILLFADSDTYCRYVSPFDPEVERIRSAGVCMREGYVHVALRPGPPESLQRAMLHELTHACLSHLNLPEWFEEGVTQLAEEAALPTWARFTIEGSEAAELRQYWREHGLNDFWWGQGFLIPDEGHRHSYQLAQILFRLLMADHGRKLPDFVRHAHADDAGESSAREFLGKGLGELAADFLGPGTWVPVPPDSPAFCRRGTLYLSRDQYDKAIADFTEGIRLDPRFSDNFSNRGYAHYQLGHYAAATADLEQAGHQNPRDHHAHNALAWIKATCPEAEHRNGERAVELAHKACELSGFSLWFCLGTLAAAYAEAGDFEEARTWAKEAMLLAPEGERLHCKERLRLYRNGKPCHEAPKPATKALGG